MPQLDTLSFASQLFWLLVSFGILCFLMYNKIVPSISSVLQTRQDKISNDLEMAEKLSKEADDLKDSYEQSFKKVRANASKITAKAEADIQSLRAQKISEVDTVLAEKAQEAEKNIEKNRQLIVKETNQLAAEMSILVAKKISGLKVTKLQSEKAVKKVTI